MYSKVDIIADTPGFEVTSYGNGLAYLVKNKRDGRECFFHAADAARFRDMWERLEDARPMCSTDSILAELWSDYMVS